MVVTVPAWAADAPASNVRAVTTDAIATFERCMTLTFRLSRILDLWAGETGKTAAIAVSVGRTNPSHMRLISTHLPCGDCVLPLM